MKVLVRVFVLALIAAAFYAFSGPNSASNGENNGAFITQNFQCGMFDGNGGYYIGNGVVSVINNGRQEILICNASGVPNETGRAVIYNNFYCDTYLGQTTDSRETVSASGQASLQCKLLLEE
ncbi:MAG: hypothetical protein EP344_19525 [Bacteroidetes bacterium]|nr:MAG: hypothetical protein EP344_19525 [Bacteroidota bacterium]